MSRLISSLLWAAIVSTSEAFVVSSNARPYPNELLDRTNTFRTATSLYVTSAPKPRVKAQTYERELESTLDAELVEKVENFDLSIMNAEQGSIAIETKSTAKTDEAQLGIWAARAILMGVAVLWGTNFASVKYLATLCFHPPCNHPPSEAALARFGVAALVSLPLLVNQRKEVIFAGLECGLFITMGYITQAVSARKSLLWGNILLMRSQLTTSFPSVFCFQMALATIPAGKCAFICSLTVVVVPVISALFFGKSIKPVNVVSAVIAVLGVGVLEGMVDIPTLIGSQPADVSVTETSIRMASTATTAIAAESSDWFGTLAASLGLAKGDILALGQALGFGIAFMRIEHYVEKFEDVENRIITMSAAQCVAVGFLSLLWVLHDFHGTIPNMEYMIEPHRIGAILWTGIMTTVVAIYLEGVALQVASATEAALVFASEPVWATLFGSWLLHENVNMNSYVGGAIILTACITSAVADLPSSDNDDDEGVSMSEAEAIDLPIDQKTLQGAKP